MAVIAAAAATVTTTTLSSTSTITYYCYVVEKDKNIYGLPSFSFLLSQAGNGNSFEKP